MVATWRAHLADQHGNHRHEVELAKKPEQRHRGKQHIGQDLSDHGVPDTLPQWPPCEGGHSSRRRALGSDQLRRQQEACRDTNEAGDRQR